MGFTSFLKSVFTNEQDDNGNSLPAMTKRSDAEKTAKRNGTGDLTNQKLNSSQNRNSGLVSKNNKKLYETDEQLSRLTSEDLSVLYQSSDSNKDFSEPVFDLNDYDFDSDPPNDKANSTTQDSTSTDPELLEEGHVLLGKAARVSSEILELLTLNQAKYYRILPVAILDNELAILYTDKPLMDNSKRVITSKLAAKKLNLTPVFYKTTWEFLKTAIHFNYMNDASLDLKNLALDHTWTSSADTNSKTLIFDANTSNFDEQQNKYKQLFIDIVRIAHDAEATDLDIDVEEDPKTGEIRLLITINVNGQRLQILNAPTTKREARRFGVVIRATADLDTSNDQDAATGIISGTFIYGTRSARLELRCNVMPHEDGIMSFSIRIQKPDEFVYTASNLNLYPEQIQLVRRYFVRSVGGFGLFVGPTGAGKNTSQMTFLQERIEHFPGTKIITIEDPVEIKIKGILQFSLKKNKGYDYFIPAAMRHIPNMLVIGETRDPITAKLALKASESGHFVSSTVHADNCIQALERMISLECDIYKLANSLKIIVAQRLVGKTCKQCVKVADPMAREIPKLRMFVNNIGGDSNTEFLKASGKMDDGTKCQVCRGTGINGRIGVFEIMVFNNEMRDLIINRAGHKIQECAIKNGMTTLWVNGLRRALSGEVSLSALERALGFPDPQHEGLNIDRSTFPETEDVEDYKLN